MESLVHMFPLTSTWCQDSSTSSQSMEASQSLEKLSSQASPFVLFGEEKVGLTTLLFQAAVSYAAKDANVLYICHQPLTRMPLGVHGMPHPDVAVLRNVKFVYMKTIIELLEYCASVHTKAVLPEVMIIDNIDFYLEQIKEDGIEHGTARLCALLIDAVSYFKCKSDGKQCHLLISCKDKQKNLQSVFKKFKFSLASLFGHSEGNVKKLEFHSRIMDVSLLYKITLSEVCLQTVEMKRTE